MSIKESINELVILLLLAATIKLLPSSGELIASNAIPKAQISRLVLLSVARHQDSDSFRRFNESVQFYNLDLEILAIEASNENELTPRKLELISKALASHRKDPELAVMLLDTDVAVLNGGRREILSRFLHKTAPETRILVANSTSCQQRQLTPEIGGQWAEGRQPGQLPPALIGAAPDVWRLVERLMLGPAADVYADEQLRQLHKLELDINSELFETLASASAADCLHLDLEDGGAKLRNVGRHSEPLLLMAVGLGQTALNGLSNYLAGHWTLGGGCSRCANQTIVQQTDGDEPLVFVALFLEGPTPFVDEFFESVLQLNYTRQRMHLLVHSQVAHHEPELARFVARLERMEGERRFASFQVARSSVSGAREEAKWRDFALAQCRRLNCDFYLSLDSLGRLDSAQALRQLVALNLTLVAPMLTRATSLWSNFWGALSEPDGFYARSFDYVNLVQRRRVGLWNVAHIMDAYLVAGRLLRAHPELSYQPPEPVANGSLLLPSVVFSRRLRELGVFQWMSNEHELGHLVDPSTYNISLKHPDFYQLHENPQEWEQRYLHKNYSYLLEDPTKPMEQPCQDVYWFPLVSELFCRQLIEIMENFGQWSGGKNEDPRIEGGYESVPTRDIHMKQVGLQNLWLEFIADYVMPVQLRQYTGYEHDPPRAELAFVVRYHPEEQPSLRPHHDSSTYTLNIALNSPGVDYEGGGCRFIRYNCSVTQSRPGWALIHPGRLTHYHEGLPVTNGTRYIMVSFVDP